MIYEQRKTKINVWDKNNYNWKTISILIDKFQKISYLESKLKSAGLELSANALATSLLEREGIDSSIIEGTQTNHNEMYFDITDGIRDKYSWEVRNLINLYKSSFRDFQDGILDYTVEDLSAMHRNLFSRDVEGFENNFDPVQIIKSVKPGKIISDDSKPNWIGTPGRPIEEASLVLIKPSEKKKYLKDMFEVIRNNKGKRDVESLIMFHPFFEAIHPFADGNGRLGRLLLVNLFSYLGFAKYNWIFVSDYWRKHREEYLDAIREVQTTDDWTGWVYFFVKSLNETVDLAYKKLNGVLELYQDTISGATLSVTDREVLNMFFKFPALNKATTIKYLMSKGVPQARAYRSFNKIAVLIGAKEEDNFKFTKMFKIISE